MLREIFCTDGNPLTNLKFMSKLKIHSTPSIKHIFMTLNRSLRKTITFWKTQNYGHTLAQSDVKPDNIDFEEAHSYDTHWKCYPTVRFCAEDGLVW